MLGRGSFEIRMGNEQRTLKSGLRPFIISLYEGVLFMNSYFHPKWMSFPEHHKARAPLIGPHRVGIITKAMSPKRSSNLCIGYIRAPWVVGRMMSFLMGPRQSKQGWGGGCDEASSSIQNPVQSDSIVSGVFSDLLALLLFNFFGSLGIVKPSSTPLQLGCFKIEGHMTQYRSKTRMHILRSTSMISKIGVLCGPPH